MMVLTCQRKSAFRQKDAVRRCGSGGALFKECAGNLNRVDKTSTNILNTKSEEKRTKAEDRKGRRRKGWDTLSVSL